MPAMGKGDRKTKRGKIFQGTTGKTRPKGKRKKNKAATAEKKTG
jgi:30S ribosomal protein S31